MKKLFILCSIIFISICISAQNPKGTKTNFADQLLELLNYSKDGFKTIKGDVNEVMTEENKTTHNTYYKTSYSLEMASKEYIVELGSSKTLLFKAYFGKDLTLTSGRGLFNALSAKIIFGFTDGFVIKTDSYKTRVQREDDNTHYIELTFINEDTIDDYIIEVLLTIK